MHNIAVTPVPISLILCDDVIYDQRTRKWHVIGWADCFRVVGFPHRARDFKAFVALTGTEGTVTCHLECFGPTGEKIFASPSRKLIFPRSERISSWHSSIFAAFGCQSPAFTPSAAYATIRSSVDVQFACYRREPTAMYESNPFTFSDAELVVLEDTVIDYTQKRESKNKPRRQKAQGPSRKSAKQNRRKRPNS